LGSLDSNKASLYCLALYSIQVSNTAHGLEPLHHADGREAVKRTGNSRASHASGGKPLLSACKAKNCAFLPNSMWRYAVKYRGVFLLIVGLLAAAVLQRTPSVSGDDWLPILPEEIKMTSVPEAPGAPAVYLYRQVDRKDLGRANTEFNYARIKILTEEGRNYANVEIPYRRGTTAISNIRARTIRPDGTIANFDGKVYDKTISKTRGVSYLAKTFSLPDVQVGSIVEYRFNYDLEDGFVFDSLWVLSEELFTKKAKFTLKPYDRLSVKWSWPAGLPIGTPPPTQDADKVIRMTVQSIPAFQLEDFMPPANELKLRVEFVYSEDIAIERDQAKYWRQFGKKQNDRVESFIGKSGAMQQAVAQIVSPNDSPEVKLQKIYARTQQVRNLSYEPRRTEQEAKRDKLKAGNNAADLLNNGYGWGSEITWLFLALAKAAGFEAYPVLASSRNEFVFNPVRLNSRELNSNVVLVKLNGKDVYFDPGTAFAPFGLVPWTEAGASGLKLDKEGGSWVTTALPDSSASRIERKADLKLTDDGSLTGKITVTFTGLEALTRRLQVRNEDEAARKKYLEDLLSEYVPVGMEAELKNQPDWKNSSAPLIAEYEVKIPGWASSAGKRALLAVGLFGGTEKHLFEHAHREFPVVFEFPFKKTDDVTIELPPGWQVGSTPKDVDQDAKAVEYIFKSDGKNGTIHFNRILRSDLSFVPADKYPVLRNFFQVVRSGDEQQIVLQQGAAAASK
jgi:hypothetical protein